MSRKRSKKYTIEVPIVIILFLFLGIWIQNKFFNPSAIQPKPSVITTADKVKCIDGDTFKYDNQKVRLLAVDTPETVHPSKPVEPFGKEASERTCDLLMNARSIQLDADKGNEFDKYDRALFWVIIDGKLLQETLLEEGLAEVKYVDERTVNRNFLNVIEKAQAKAQNLSIGIWGN